MNLAAIQGGSMWTTPVVVGPCLPWPQGIELSELPTTSADCPDCSSVSMRQISHKSPEIGEPIRVRAAQSGR
jgi:hypothetical protein